ncbi:MerR family transcriptional regulator [Pedobacter africanus]|uniref:DNA-binding transcriptional regulator, MerR family n=1 Tax=Pedobacter africanus TaxID=151894 RepID=A0A1W1Z958_9SPHI|nr:MerR family transcriptional regulator [Pedobacter africanus]SMC44478.1 DNA-binding transcriptional regulator, MerR family [Pedobacter africanus]
MKKQVYYSVKQLARLSGITVKTLHLYDKIGLLKPAERTDARYRLYGKEELLRLQQILFYKELDFPLKEILLILDDPDFDLILALQGHKRMLQARKARIGTLMKTIDNTIHSIKNKTMLKLEDLYEGLSADEAKKYRDQAIDSYGEEVVIHAEEHLKSLSKSDMQVLVLRQKELGKAILLLKDLPADSDRVQGLVHEHYLNTRKLWGTHDASDKQAEAYYGLGQLYLSDERFTSESGVFGPEFRTFISEAIAAYVNSKLR